MKVALVHDDLVQWGGAERVLLGISELFPQAPIYTASFNQGNPILKEQFKDKKIITSFIQNIPGKDLAYRSLLPLYSLAFEQFDFSEFDLVISQTTKFAKAIITKPSTTHICYCHTPPRFLWKFSGEKVSKWLSPYINYLRIYDQIVSNRVDYFLAGSKNCQQRIKTVYKTESEVLYPFIDLARFENLQSFNGGYYLLITRLNKYKNVDLAVKVFNKLGMKLKIVGTGPEFSSLANQANPNIEFLGPIDEELLLNLLCGCQALIVTAEEDFGLASLEAQACGKGVVAYAKGGNLETVIDGKTGVLFSQLNPASLEQAIERLTKIKINSKAYKENANRFSKQAFQKNLSNMIKSKQGQS